MPRKNLYPSLKDLSSKPAQTPESIIFTCKFYTYFEVLLLRNPHWEWLRHLLNLLLQSSNMSSVDMCIPYNMDKIPRRKILQHEDTKG
jgi:hypothetical protein